MKGPYKILHLMENGAPHTVYVFIGDRVTTNNVAEADSLWRSDPTNKLFDGVFTPEEQDLYKEVRVVFTAHSIYPDDSIAEIKKKICLAADVFVYAGIYMFGTVDRQLNTDDLYQTLTTGGKTALRADRLGVVVRSVIGLQDAMIEKTDDGVYTYDSVLKLDLGARASWKVEIPIGTKYSEEFAVVPNPFKQYGDNAVEVRTADGELLMGAGQLHNNTINVCSAVDVLPLHKNSALYYPILDGKNISTISDYDAMEVELREDTKQLVANPAFKRAIGSISLLKEISTLPLADSEVHQKRGIKKGRITLHPQSAFVLPLDIVFKLLHSTEKRPLIKYNPGRRQEKIYRLYASGVATDGRKIPLLPKSTVLRLARVLAKEKQVAVFIAKDNWPIVISFFADARVDIAFSAPAPIPEQELAQILKDTCNPVIEDVGKFMATRGYVLPVFSSLRSIRTELSSFEITMTDSLGDGLDVQKASSCISAALSLVATEENGAMEFAYKRVANFNEMDAIEAFIVRQFNNGVRDHEIADSLTTQFDFSSREEAKQRMAEFLSGQQAVQDAYRRKRVRIKNNPGFPVYVRRDRFKGTLVTSVHNVNSAEYFDMIGGYVSAMVRLSEACPITGIPAERIKELCNQPQTGSPAVEASDAEQIKFSVDKAAKKDFMDLLLGDESDDDSDDEESDGTAGVGAVNVDGLKLLNPNPFSLRLQEYEPLLFRARKGPTSYSYSRACPSNNKRQPVILTAKEKADIDAQHPGSYTHALSYKPTDGGEEFYYICPRYWDLRRGTSLTKEEVDSGEHGDVIPMGSRSVPAGANIYEFDGPYHRDARGQYMNLAPGFMKPKTHPDGKCVPCCFKSWDAPARAKLRASCQGQSADEAPARRDRKRGEFDSYVKGPEKWPLEAGRIGYLPPAFEMFIGVSNRDCQVSRSDANIRLNTPCIVRLGVEKSGKQSFLAAVASLYSEEVGGRPLTVTQMGRHLSSLTTLDQFAKLQNGALVPIFASVELDTMHQIPGEYVNSSLVKMTDPSNATQMAALATIISAYVSYQEYLSSEESKVEHQYLWDLITKPNPRLFPRGINLVIMEEGDGDGTADIRLICPSNHYADSFFSQSLNTAVLICRESIYEVLILYEDTKAAYRITKLFKTDRASTGVLGKLTSVIQSIGSTINKKCNPLPSMPRVYDYTPNANCSTVQSALVKMNFQINKRITNYNGKVLGFDVQRGARRGMIPCFPSTMPESAAAGAPVWLDDFVGESYSKTRELLDIVHRESEGTVVCRPLLKATEDGLLVGIMTAGNQFVPLGEPEQDTFGNDLQPIVMGQYEDANRVGLVGKGQDEARTQSMKRIKLESVFFETFRNQVRTLLGEFANVELRSQLVAVLDSHDQDYYMKMGQVIAFLTDLLEDKVSFVTTDERFISDILGTRDLAAFNVCVQDSEQCRLLIPKTNLINSLDNEKVYFGRMADELVRYTRIKDFILNPAAFLSFSHIQYELNQDEIILLQSLLDQAYFENLVPKIANEFVKGSGYDTAQPHATEQYSERAELQPQAATVTCPKPTVRKVTGKWQRVFPSGSEELEFPNDPAECTFQVLLAIASSSDSGVTSVATLKKQLVSAYDEAWPEFGSKIIAILSSEGKQSFAKVLRKNEITMDTVVSSQHYFARTWICGCLLITCPCLSFSIVPPRLLLARAHSWCYPRAMMVSTISSKCLVIGAQLRRGTSLLCTTMPSDSPPPS